MLIWSLLSLGCTPILTTPGRGDDSGTEASDWSAPENTWSSSSPPPGLVGEGWQRDQVIPDVRLMDQHGDEVSLWQFYGSVVLLDVSTMWCSPCAELADEVDTTWHDYEDQGFIYVTMLPQDVAGQVPDQADLQTWASDHSITAPILSNDQGHSDQIVPPGAAYPRLLLIDRSSTVLIEDIQPAEDATIRSSIESAL